MEKVVLNCSEVVFDAEHHTYELNGHQLSGVTPIIHWLFPDTYKGIPQHVLDAAAEHGTLIHSKCELADTMGIVDEDIVREYQELLEQRGLKVLLSEYLVSDERNVASCIDKVFTDDSLGDIKTTSKVHLLNVTIQLSIYAWLYEMQNPDRKVPHLYLIWLPKPQYGQPEIKELRRIDAEWCKMAVERYLAGDDPLSCVAELAAMGFNPEPVRKRVEGEIPEAMQPIIDELMIVKKQLDIYTEREKELRAALLEAMQGVGEDKWYNDLIQISRRAESTRISIDTKLFKEKDPDLYDECANIVKVKESLTYKLL